jgi:hypothetical protein
VCVARAPFLGAALLPAEVLTVFLVTFAAAAGVR